LKQAYQLLFKHYGEQDWWPGETSFEVMVGAILTQNTNWGNVEKAIGNLKRRNLLEPLKLSNLHHRTLASLIRPAGYYNVKTKRLKSFLAFLMGEYGGDIRKMSKYDLHLLRRKMLEVKGIGKETADSILLYALNKEIFVVDAYTYRILMRHGVICEEAEYDEIQDLFHDSLPSDIQMYNEFHALIVRVGKEYCKPKPKCEECPLKNWANRPTRV
jgi:endonuclease-3 related protein